MTQAPNPKPNLANTRLDPDVVEKLGKVFSLMESASDGEALAAVRTLNRVLKANDVDPHVLVARMKNSWVSDEHKAQFTAKVEQARAAGRAEGEREATARLGLRDDFDGDGADASADWRLVARFVGRERHRLPLRNRDDRTSDFIDSMVALAASPHTDLSPARANWLFDLFGKLGGKIT
jgi:hypothetical protein